MKKDLKKLLSAQAQNILPDERVKENIKSELGCSDGERAYAHGGTESKGKKNILVISVAVLMALTLCLCILLPVFLKGQGRRGSGKFNQIETTEDFYAVRRRVRRLAAFGVVGNADAALLQTER